MGKVGKTKRTF